MKAIDRDSPIFCKLFSTGHDFVTPIRSVPSQVGHNTCPFASLPPPPA